MEPPRSSSEARIQSFVLLTCPPPLRALQRRRVSIRSEGYFISKGIGTKKNRREGVRMMLESGVEEYYKFFATDIGLYFLDLAKEEEEEDKDDNYARAFEWFEKGYMMRKTTATINNYALCFLKRIFVEKDIEKAKCILKEGVFKGDPESMHNLAQILESTDIVESLEYYKRASSIGHKKSESRYSSLITEIDDGKLTK
ncbi:hypothetical protein M9Y10_012218 [Tritrichomonas musculus]|uniref:Uncharacterized protein n=1 Tax=Tritrichomonas musculus TaxID=1915356 RepID=A0ABR2IBY4_9EUKA